MQQSMTGYGQGSVNSDNHIYTVEIKTLNSKYFDYIPRYPKELSEKDYEIKNVVSDALKRGKVTINIEISHVDSSESNVQIDKKLFKSYYQTMKELANEVGAEQNDLMRLALLAPEVMRQQEIVPEAISWTALFDAIKKACNQCQSFRQEEGLALEKKLDSYVQKISQCLDKIIQIDPERQQKIREKLQKKIEEIRDRVQVDANRFEQELIYYIEKIDITEEKVRLEQHLKHFYNVLLSESNAGKKLNFISQEIGREINTIGSKANYSQIQQIVVEMKDELEKIKEQSLNIL